MRVLVRGPPGRDGGQINIDFLFGFGVFLVAFIYIATFIPGLFAPFQPGAIDLSSVAYRTSAILVEDPGWYTYTSADGSLAGDADWENHIGQLARVGLADDKALPNVISLKKVTTLRSLMSTPAGYGTARDKMGLSGSVIYDVNISLVMDNTLANTRENLIAPSCPNATSHAVENMRRNVMVDMGPEVFIDSWKAHNNPQIGGFQTILFENISDMITRDADVTIRFFNTSGPIPITDVGVGPDNYTWGRSLTQDNDYTVMLNGMTIHYLPTVHPGDIVEIRVYSSAINDVNNIKSVDIKSSDSSAFPGGIRTYNNDPFFKQKRVLYPGTLDLDVWSYAFA